MARTNAPVPPRLRSEFADDPDMREIIEAFASEMPGKVGDLRACWEKRDLDRLMRLAHQLEGASGGYGFPTISEAAGRLESSLASIVGRGDPVPLHQIQTEYNRLIDLCVSVENAGR